MDEPIRGRLRDGTYEPARLGWVVQRGLLHAYHRIELVEQGPILRITSQPAAMDVHVLLPRQLSIGQTDRYVPEPESIARNWENTWHLTAETSAAATEVRFLAVMLPHRVAGRDRLPGVELLEGSGAVGVRLKAPDGADEIVGFCTATGDKAAILGDLDDPGVAFARGRDTGGRVVRRFGQPLSEP